MRLQIGSPVPSSVDCKKRKEKEKLFVKIAGRYFIRGEIKNFVVQNAWELAMQP